MYLNGVDMLHSCVYNYREDECTIVVSVYCNWQYKMFRVQMLNEYHLHM